MQLYILIFSKNRARRGLGLTAAFPMIFNINELMVFGLPIIFNPLMLIPFSVHLLGNSKYTSDNSIKTPLHIKLCDTSYSPMQSYGPFPIIQWMHRP